MGYINIPDTVISYPVVQRRSEDGNDYYMDKNIDKEEAKAGTIFLDWRNNFDYVVNGTKVMENSQNLVIYGHDMKDDSMFGSLASQSRIVFFETKDARHALLQPLLGDSTILHRCHDCIKSLP